jgi:hypothetical protein
MMFAAKHVIHAPARQTRRPKRVDGTPAVAELMKAPSVISEEMSFCFGGAVAENLGFNYELCV